MRNSGRRRKAGRGPLGWAAAGLGPAPVVTIDPLDTTFTGPVLWAITWSVPAAGVVTVDEGQGAGPVSQGSQASGYAYASGSGNGGPFTLTVTVSIPGRTPGTASTTYTVNQP
jgi:hypothetical protein